MKVHAKKHNKGERSLVSVAKSIGSAMGMIAGRVNAVQRAVTHRAPVARSVRRRGKTVVGNRKEAKQTAAADRDRRKRARAARRGSRRQNSSAKRGA